MQINKQHTIYTTINTTVHSKNQSRLNFGTRSGRLFHHFCYSLLNKKNQVVFQCTSYRLFTNCFFQFKITTSSINTNISSIAFHRNPQYHFGQADQKLYTDIFLGWLNWDAFSQVPRNLIKLSTFWYSLHLSWHQPKTNENTWN